MLTTVRKSQEVLWYFLVSYHLLHLYNNSVSIFYPIKASELMASCMRFYCSVTVVLLLHVSSSFGIVLLHFPGLLRMMLRLFYILETLCFDSNGSGT